MATVTSAQSVEDTIAYYRGHEDTRSASIPLPGTIPAITLRAALEACRVG